MKLKHIRYFFLFMKIHNFKERKKMFFVNYPIFKGLYDFLDFISNSTLAQHTIFKYYKILSKFPTFSKCFDSISMPRSIYHRSSLVVVFSLGEKKIVKIKKTA